MAIDSPVPAEVFIMIANPPTVLLAIMYVLFTDGAMILLIAELVPPTTSTALRASSDTPLRSDSV